MYLKKKDSVLVYLKWLMQSWYYLGGGGLLADMLWYEVALFIFFDQYKKYQDKTKWNTEIVSTLKSCQTKKKITTLFWLWAKKLGKH